MLLGQGNAGICQVRGSYTQQVVAAEQVSASIPRVQGAVVLGRGSRSPLAVLEQTFDALAAFVAVC